MATNDDWLALTIEETLQPKLPICDPHHHLWDFRRDVAAPRYLLDDLLEPLTNIRGLPPQGQIFLQMVTRFRGVCHVIQIDDRFVHIIRRISNVFSHELPSKPQTAIVHI